MSANLRLSSSRATLQAVGGAESSFPSVRLYNDDIAPVQRANRHWKAYHVFTLWANDVHSLGNYIFAIGLFALGLGAWQILLTIAIGASALFVLLTLSGLVGKQTGLPFPVVSRIAFGIRGGRIAAVCRGFVAIVWFGIQTYLAANVLAAILVQLAPGLQRFEQGQFLGLSTLNWFAFGLLWVVQLAVVRHGLAMIRYFVAVAGPVVLITMVGLAVHAFAQAGYAISWSTDAPLTGSRMWGAILGGACLWVVIYGTFALNVCDFTRCCGTDHAVIVGNFVGVLLNMMLFAAIVVVLSGAQFHINGQIIKSPADMVATIADPGWRVAVSVVLVVLTMAVNMVANFVAPNYMLSDLWPRVLDFKRASLITAILGVIILPWKLYDSPLAINFFLSGLGAVLGPFFGLMMVDYWIVRKRRVDIPALYSEAPDGSYFYRNGINWRAFTALIPSAIVALVLSIVPNPAAQFSWMIGAALAAVLHLVLSEKTQVYSQVDGEAIARPSR